MTIPMHIIRKAGKGATREQRAAERRDRNEAAGIGWGAGTVLMPGTPGHVAPGWMGMTESKEGAKYGRKKAASHKTPHVGPPKITRAPPITHDVRYQVAPGETVFGAGFAAVGVGRDVETGQPWA